VLEGSRIVRGQRCTQRLYNPRICNLLPLFFFVFFVFPSPHKLKKKKKRKTNQPHASSRRASHSRQRRSVSSSPNPPPPRSCCQPPPNNPRVSSVSARCGSRAVCRHPPTPTPPGWGGWRHPLIRCQPARSCGHRTGMRRGPAVPGGSTGWGAGGCSPQWDLGKPPWVRGVSPTWTWLWEGGTWGHLWGRRRLGASRTPVSPVSAEGPSLGPPHRAGCCVGGWGGLHGRWGCDIEDQVPSVAWWGQHQDGRWGFSPLTLRCAPTRGTLAGTPGTAGQGDRRGSAWRLSPSLPRGPASGGLWVLPAP